MKEPQATFFLNNISEFEFSVKEPSIDIINHFEYGKLNLTFNHSLDVDFKEGRLSIKFLIKYRYPAGEPNPHELLSIEEQFDYMIHDIESVITVNPKGEYVIPDSLLLTVVSTAYSTIRGIIVAKTKNYFINRFYLPIINPQVLLKTHPNSNESKNKKKDV